MFVQKRRQVAMLVLSKIHVMTYMKATIQLKGFVAIQDLLKGKLLTLFR